MKKIIKKEMQKKVLYTFQESIYKHLDKASFEKTMKISIKIIETELCCVEDEDRKKVWSQTRNISVPLRIVFLPFSFNFV